MTGDFNSLVWSPAPSSLKLGAEEVHLWRASLDCDPSVLSRLEATLSPDEIARADRFVFETDRSHFVAARGILRELLGSYLMHSPAGLQFGYANRGKPSLQTGTGSSPLQFNLSHSGGLAVYAFSQGRSLGIDVERIRPHLAGEDIARRYFAARELAELQALPPQLRADGFFLCWTRKEAYVKAHGAGLSMPLDSFAVSLTPGRAAELRSVDSARWSMHSFEPSTGYVATIVGEGSGWSSHYWIWRP